MAREKDRAQKRQPVADIHAGKPLATRAQKIEAHERDDRADPVHELHAELHEQTEEGDEDDIHGGDEAGFSDRRVDDAVLLDDAGRAQKKAADRQSLDTAEARRPPPSPMVLTLLPCSPASAAPTTTSKRTRKSAAKRTTRKRANATA